MHPVQSPRTDDAAIEQDILSKGLTAPRVTPADIEANIASEHCFTALDGVLSAGGSGIRHAAASEAPDSGIALGLLTFCVLVLRDGPTASGESACASPENFDAEIGKKIARANAVNKSIPR